MSNPGAVLDHLVYATPDLDATIADVERALGVRAAIGGRHVGRGTWNAILSFGDGSSFSSYLELIAPDPSQPDPEGPRPFGVDLVDSPRLVTWAVRTTDLDALLVAARSGGYDPGPAMSMQRDTPEGDLLSWRLTMPPIEGDGLIPFVIDWGATTAHPSMTSPVGVTLARFDATYPNPAAITAAWDALGLPSTAGTRPSVADGVQSRLSALLTGPSGQLVL